MLELTLPFIISQVAAGLAIGFDFLSLQFKKRQQTFLCLIISASLISAHFFLLHKTAAGVIVFLSVLRFITCYFTTNKKYLYIFIVLNTVALFFTYQEIYDVVIYVGIVLMIIGNFQANNKFMRQIMMLGTATIMLYNLIIFSPVGFITEGSFLLSNFIGYYRYYVRKKWPNRTH